MTDLRGKVLMSLDDPKLEVQELGVNLSVLRLLETPPSLIITKFLAAHKQRANRIVKTFAASLSREASTAIQEVYIYVCAYNLLIIIIIICNCFFINDQYINYSVL